MHEVLPIRPYENRIRERVFRVLKQAGLSVDLRRAIPPGLSDEEVVQRLSLLFPSVLLVPYNAQVDDQGVSSNGLELAQRIEEALPRLKSAPILMPVSATAIEGVRGMLGYRTRRAPVTGALRARILLISVADLDDPTLPARIRKHVEDAPALARESA